MRYSLALPAGDPSWLVDAARGLEAAGIDAGFVTDHPAPDTRWLAGGGHHALEPTVALAAAGAVTTTLRLHTNIYVLAYRNPFLAAKALASVDVLSGGRLIMGVAAGYLRPEFDALGVPFEDRGRRLDESLRIIVSSWTGEVVVAEGDGWSARGVLQRPAPATLPPIWIGGNGANAIRRAAGFGHGWSPFPTTGPIAAATRTAPMSSVVELAAGVERYRDALDAAGHGELNPDVCFTPFGFDDYLDGSLPTEAIVEQIMELEAAGVTWLALTPTLSDRARYEHDVARIRDELVTPGTLP